MKLYQIIIQQHWTPDKTWNNVGNEANNVCVEKPSVWSDNFDFNIGHKEDQITEMSELRLFTITCWLVLTWAVFFSGTLQRWCYCCWHTEDISGGNSIKRSGKTNGSSEPHCVCSVTEEELPTESVRSWQAKHKEKDRVWQHPRLDCR